MFALSPLLLREAGSHLVASTLIRRVRNDVDAEAQDWTQGHPRPEEGLDSLGRPRARASVRADGTGLQLIYALKYRTSEGRQRWQTIGRPGRPGLPKLHAMRPGEFSPRLPRAAIPPARSWRSAAAQQWPISVTSTWRRPPRDALLTRRGKDKKKSTLATDRSRIEAHIKPLLGARKISEVDRHDVEKFMHDIARGATKRRSHLGRPRAISVVRGGRGAATRTVGLLGAIFGDAARSGLRADNPVAGLIRFADGRRDRRLSDGEYRQLGDGASLSTGVWPPAVAAARFLALTGWRSGEALRTSDGAISICKETWRGFPTPRRAKACAPFPWQLFGRSRI